METQVFKAIESIGKYRFLITGNKKSPVKTGLSFFVKYRFLFLRLQSFQNTA